MGRHGVNRGFFTTEEQRWAEKKQAEDLLKTEKQRDRVICNIDFSLLGGSFRGTKQQRNI